MVGAIESEEPFCVKMGRLDETIVQTSPNERRQPFVHPFPVDPRAHPDGSRSKMESQIKAKHADKQLPLLRSFDVDIDVCYLRLGVLLPSNRTTDFRFGPCSRASLASASFECVDDVAIAG